LTASKSSAERPKEKKNRQQRKPCRQPPKRGVSTGEKGAREERAESKAVKRLMKKKHLDLDGELKKKEGGNSHVVFEKTQESSQGAEKKKGRLPHRQKKVGPCFQGAEDKKQWVKSSVSGTLLQRNKQKAGTGHN